MESLASLGYNFDQKKKSTQTNKEKSHKHHQKKTQQATYFAIEFVSSVPNILYLDLMFLRLNVWD